MKRILSVFSLIVTLVFLFLFVRSRGLDEGFEFGNEYVKVSGYRQEYFFSLGWGPHGIRLFSRLESGEIRQFDPPLNGGTWEAWSVPYKMGSSWGWPVETFWNKQGFWWSDETYTGDNEWTRRISLVAVPLWLPIALFFPISIILALGSRRNRRAEQAGTGQSITNSRGSLTALSRRYSGALIATEVGMHSPISSARGRPMKFKFHSQE